MEATKDSKDISVHILIRLSEGHSRQQVESDLIELGHEERFIKELVHEAVKLRNSKKRVLGLSLILAGAIVCLLSCILAITLHMSQGNFSLVLYGFTSIGIILVFAGFTQVF